MFSKRTSGKVVLVTDVGDLSVGVSIVVLADSGPATILAGERKTLPIEERTLEQSAAAISTLLEQTIESVLKSYMADAKKNPKPPAAAYAILHSPWTRFRTAEAVQTYEDPRTITKEGIASLAKEALTQPSDLDRSNILEAGVLNVYLNGYLTGNPVGKKATRAGVIAFESDVNPSIKRTVSDVLAKLLPGRPITIRSGMCALTALLQEHMPEIHRYVVLDVGGSVTSCSVVMKEAVSKVVLVPEGLASILKRVSSATLPEEILTQLRMLATDTCSTDACRALKDSLARAEPDLTKVFGEAFAQMAAKRRLPNYVMLSSPTELSPWLQGFFSRIDFSQFTATMQPFEVEPLTPDHLREIVSWKSGSLTDTGIGVAAGYVNILARS